MSSPDRGEIWLVDLGYVAKVRPCLVISIPALDQDRALATLIHIQQADAVQDLRYKSKLSSFEKEFLTYKTSSQFLMQSFYEGWEV
jgi:mRNA-degrading endonuclease toxin of MazEF toxin-antitoxin module